MYPILAKETLSPNVTRLDVFAPRIAEIRRAGQFVIVRNGEGAERIPLTIADADPLRGSISLVIQAVGKSTRDIVALEVGDFIRDVAGPLGMPTELIDTGHALCVGGGVGTAVVHPIAQALHSKGIRVTSVIGGRTRPRIIFERDLQKLGSVIVCTDDGSHGRKGLVTDAVSDLLAAGGIDIVYAIGPVMMMRAVAEITRPFNIHTIISANPVMVDGTGMCGGCRVDVGGETKFACVHGPEFDGHQFDFDLLADRLKSYRDFEEEVENRTESPQCSSGHQPAQSSVAESNVIEVPGLAFG